MNWKVHMPSLEVKDKEINHFLSYINDKGIYLHKQIYDLILTTDLLCEYELLAKILRYDKGLRNVLYKYLSAFEEKYRALLFENYDVQIQIDDPELAKIEKLNLVQRTSVQSKLYDISYSRYFSLNVLRKTLFDLKLINDDVNSDFSDIAKLRNKTMHHNILMSSYHRDINNVNKEILKIQSWIVLLYKYLPEGMNIEFEKAINRCNNIGTKMNVPNLNVICLREMRNGVFI